MNIMLLLLNIFITYFVFASGVIKTEDFKLEYPTSISDLPAIEVHGNKFFNSMTNEQFFLKGIAYQPSYSMNDLKLLEGEAMDTKYIDPLASPDLCLRDIPHLVELGVNTIRVYAIDPTKSHDVCMKELAANGIYVLLDLSEPDNSISRDSPTWDVSVYQRYKDVVDSMHQYSNVLGFFAGNEVTNDITNTDASPFVKASIRDIKGHISENGYRSIPIGYSTNDDIETRENLAQFFICGDSVADFYGINMYEWCGYSSYHSSGYDQRTKEFKDYPVPIFFSEFGCNSVRPRPFTEVEALYGPHMTKVWSGGLAYMYFEEENNYGVVKIDEDNEVVHLKDFDFLKDEFSRAKPKGITREEHTRKQGSDPRRKKRRECPAISKTWKAAATIPDTPNQTKCSCLEESLPCLVQPFHDPSRYKDYFEYVCSQVDCSDIKADGEKGQYGEFSDCSTNQKLALEISKMYYLDPKSSGTCPIVDGQIHYNTKSKQAPQDKRCAAIIKTVRSASKATNGDTRQLHQNSNERASSGSRNAAKWFSLTLALGILMFSFV